MKNYDNTHADLAPRDVVSRAIIAEVDAARGVEVTTSNVDKKDCVWLDMTHIEKEHMLETLPQVVETIEKYAHLDPSKDLVPIKPTAHYTMGGIPITLNSQVYKLDRGKKQSITGLYAAGECACSGVHGANRLGGNSLLDACLFGKIAGKSIAKNLQNQEETQNQNILQNKIQKIDELAKKRIQKIRALMQSENDSKDEQNPYVLLNALEEIMETAIAVRCSEKSIKEALQKTKAKKIYICNAMSQPGETDGYSLEDHIQACLLYTSPSPRD